MRSTREPTLRRKADRSVGLARLGAFFSLAACPTVGFGQTPSTLPLKLGDLDADGVPTVLDLQRLINHLNGAALLPANFAQYGDLNDDGLINQTDVDLLRDAILGKIPLPPLPTLHITEASPAHGEEMVSPVRTVIFALRPRDRTLNSQHK